MARNQEERRKFPRLLLDLPLEYWMMDARSARGGIVINASEGGFLLNSIENISLGSKLNMGLLFPKGFELAYLKVIGEVIWKDLCFSEDWEGYQYGLKLIQSLGKDFRKLGQLLNRQF